MWREQIKNVLWTHENFLDDTLFKQIRSKVLDTETVDIEQSNFKYKAHKGKLRDDSSITEPILHRLNLKYISLFGKMAPVKGLSSTQFIVKSFVPNESYYDLHMEDPKLYGDVAFMYYLTDEIDGALELPSFEFKLLPMENLCVIMKTGFMHKVNKCSGSRINITGWSYAVPSRLTKNTLKGYDQL